MYSVNMQLYHWYETHEYTILKVHINKTYYVNEQGEYHDALISTASFLYILDSEIIHDVFISVSKTTSTLTIITV